MQQDGDWVQMAASQHVRSLLRSAELCEVSRQPFPYRIMEGLPVTRAAIRHGDRVVLAHAFVTFALKPVGTIEQMKMAAVSRLTDFSFDWYPLFTPVSKKSHPSCTTRVTTAGSSKS